MKTNWKYTEHFTYCLYVPLLWFCTICNPFLFFLSKLKSPINLQSGSGIYNIYKSEDSVGFLGWQTPIYASGCHWVCMSLSLSVQEKYLWEKYHQNIIWKWANFRSACKIEIEWRSPVELFRIYNCHGQQRKFMYFYYDYLPQHLLGEEDGWRWKVGRRFRKVF